MKLTRLAGLGEDHANDSRVLPVLRIAAEQFLRAGGRLTLDEFIGFTDVEKAAAIAAGDRVFARRAAALSHAIRDEFGVAELVTVLDGGDALDELLAIEGLVE